MSRSEAMAMFSKSLNWQPSPRLVSGRWSVKTIEGHDWPMMFKTKQAAEAAAMANLKCVQEKLREIIYG